MKYTINFAYDNEADVWVATSEDVAGLVLESGSLDVLQERVRYAVPELLSLNGNSRTVLDMEFISKRHERVALNG